MMLTIQMPAASLLKYTFFSASAISSTPIVRVSPVWIKALVTRLRRENNMQSSEVLKQHDTICLRQLESKSPQRA